MFYNKCVLSIRLSKTDSSIITCAYTEQVNYITSIIY